jgi:serine/threonine protein kinase
MDRPPTVSSSAESDNDGLVRLQRYEPQREIGRGTYGRAVLVRDTAAAGNALRVLKYVDLNGLAADAADRAVTEATILRRLAHPNIVRYHESFLAEGRLCIVTDYAPNGPCAVRGKWTATGPVSHRIAGRRAGTEQGISASCCAARLPSGSTSPTR